MSSRIAIILCICLVIIGCGSSPKTQFYTLQAPPSPKVRSAVVDSSQSDVVIGPVTLPETVDRTQFVVRTGENTLDISDTNRWAEPLKNGIARVLAANLSQLLGMLRVSAFGAVGLSEHDIRVTVDILSFESTLGKTATIEALWIISRSKGSKPLRGRSLIHETLQGNDYAAVAAGHGRALTQISREIAAAIRGMGRT